MTANGSSGAQTAAEHHPTALRTTTCGALRLADAGRRVRLCGWVDRRRDHGGLVFIDLRDRYGRTQLVFDPERSGAEVMAAAQRLHVEDVVAASGTVAARAEGARNPRLATGAVEVHVDALEVLNRAAPPPFEVGAPGREGDEVSMETRMRYRYVDLRRPAMQERLRFRHRLHMELRRALDAQGFIEVETPILTRSTPEGARDYLVPSRVHPGSFYALPQSPQLFKQLLMVAGFDRYFQIARCFRDEDLRADRQPEFTQLDLEMAFVEEEDVFAAIEAALAEIWRALCPGRELSVPFPRLPYDEALLRYGTDRPDLRNPLVIQDVTALAGRAQLEFLRAAAHARDKGNKPAGAVRALVVPAGAGKLSRKDLDGLGALVAPAGAKGVGWLRVGEDGALSGPLHKGFAGPLAGELMAATGARHGDLILMVADAHAEIAARACGLLRTELGRRLGLVEQRRDAPLWVVDFPYFEYDADTGAMIACRHPFTQPRREDVSYLDSDPLRVRTRAYDLVLNGIELGSGSIRNHDPELQRRVLQVLGYSEQESEQRFGFLLEALASGAPPHGGAALGLDRLCAVLLGLDNLREVVAFPKTTSASCLLTRAPAPVEPAQLKALGIALTA
ncbi:MAG: aspartate--tRNA(Asp/Asn) ligase [Planctomycetota bacterium]|nr:MAG: aspartate--tRNA(Asp/Asn) ligase [Planctomycetota bacterium]